MTTQLSRPGTKARRTQDDVLALLGEHEALEFGLPTYTRILFYELEQRGQAVKPDPGDTRRNRRRSIGWPPGEQDVIDVVADLPKAGVIPWEWVIDGERSLIEFPHAPTVRAALLADLDDATINPWHLSPPPLVLSESKNLAQVLAGPLADLVPVIGGLKGQAGEGWLRTVARRALQGSDAGRLILYLGDADRVGEDIEANAQRVLERCTGRTLNWTRLALTEDQITSLGVEPISRLDGRDGKIRWAWELEALGQAGVIRLARDAVEARLPAPLAGVQERERAEREQLRALLNGGRQS